VALSSTLAWAEEPIGCDKFKWPVDREMAALRPPNLNEITSGTKVSVYLFDVLCLQADPAFPATANITLNLDLNGLVIRRAVADPALPFPPNDHFAPTALVCSSTAVAERDKFDKEALSLTGELIAESSQDVSLVMAITTKSVAKNSLLAVAAKRN
jgi:hypothetical protein